MHINNLADTVKEYDDAYHYMIKTKPDDVMSRILTWVWKTKNKN